MTETQVPVVKCATCWQFETHCLCPQVNLLLNKHRVLILQHPQEAKQPFSTAKLTSLNLKNSLHKVGFSWPSLSVILKEKANNENWAVLFVGTKANQNKTPVADVPFQIVKKDGTQVPLSKIKGIIILDGNWKQSKTLWWRNPWLLKLAKVVLQPEKQSGYSSLRKQPRKECLSTIEAVRESLKYLGEKEDVIEGLNHQFENHLKRHSRSSHHSTLA